MKHPLSETALLRRAALTKISIETFTMLTCITAATATAISALPVGYTLVDHILT